MNTTTVTVFGGTGFLGRRIVTALDTGGWHVQVASRHVERGNFAGNRNIEPFQADIRDPGSVARAVRNADVVINAVSLYTESRKARFEDIHVKGARLLAETARDTGTTRLVQISGIGVDTASPSKYVRARARGEEAVRNAFPDATILRPSVLFGPGDAFLSTLDGISRLPVIPLFGWGRTRLQPVHVADVARAVTAALRDPRTAGQIFELGGATLHRYREMVERVLAHRQRSRLLLPLPFALWHLMATLLAVLPNPPLTRDQLILMRSDNVAATDMPGFAELGIEPSGLADELADCLRRPG